MIIEYVVIFAAILFGTLAKAVGGIGLPLIAVPVMATFVGVQHAVVVIMFPTVATNIWLLWVHRAHARKLPYLLMFAVFAVIGAALGTWGLSRFDDRALSGGLAVWIVLYLIYAASRPEVRIGPAASRFLSPVVGTLSGVLQGATGSSGPLIGTWFHAFKLEPFVYLFAVTAVFMAMGVTQIVAMTQLGLFTTERVIGGALAIVPALLVMPFAVRLSRRVSRTTFDLVIKALLVATAVKLALHGAFGW
ncbi:MAG: TSUP family transporter [Rhodospirillales bacterium]